MKEKNSELRVCQGSCIEGELCVAAAGGWLPGSAGSRCLGPLLGWVCRSLLCLFSWRSCPALHGNTQPSPGAL